MRITSYLKLIFEVFFSSSTLVSLTDITVRRELISLFSLDEPLKTLEKRKNWPAYLNALSQSGLDLWFNMKVPEIVIPLMRVPANCLDSSEKSRIRFISELILNMGALIREERFNLLYFSCVKEEDFEAAAAVAGAGVASVWDSGRDFHRYSRWNTRIDNLVLKKKKLSSLAMASLYGFRGLIELTGRGDIKKALSDYTIMREYAETADSPSLRIFYAAAASYTLLWMGRVSEAELALSDAEPLAGLEDTSLICKAYYHSTLGLFHTINGNHEKGEEALWRIVRHPLFTHLPPPVFFLVCGHLLHALSHGNDKKRSDVISGKLRSRAIPARNNFHHAYMHFSLGVFSLMKGRPHQALLRAGEGLERGRLSGGPVSEIMPALLYGQALSDLKRYDEAIEHFEKWQERWDASGFHVLCASCSVELAHIYLKKEDRHRAAYFFEKSKCYVPPGERLHPLYRPERFFAPLGKLVLTAASKRAAALTFSEKPVRIECFGTLNLTVSGSRVYDRGWRGGRSKMLLKAIVVCGGEKISSTQLAEILWPDADGDLAAGNLKVALSRLRRVGCKKGEVPLFWVRIKHGAVSLVKSLCEVDVLLFQKRIILAKKGVCSGADPKSLTERLAYALDLYSDDFLVNEQDNRIVLYRERLRDIYTDTAIKLSEICRRAGETEAALPYLEKVIAIDPLNERGYACLMELYLKLGYRAKTLTLFGDAKYILKKELGIQPGPGLLALARQAERNSPPT